MEGSDPCGNDGVHHPPAVHGNTGTATAAFVFENSKTVSKLLPLTIMSRQRFTALLAMLHVSDPDTNNGAATQKRDKVSWLPQHINDCSASFFEPYREILVNERMVKSKTQSEIQQYIRDNVKCSCKLWVPEDPKTGYTI